jgi:hypothetical protein
LPHWDVVVCCCRVTRIAPSLLHHLTSHNTNIKVEAYNVEEGEVADTAARMASLQSERPFPLKNRGYS